MQLSIIIPAYNAQSHIEKCVISLLNQDLNNSDYEIIVVDDGSTDQTASIVSGLATRFPNIVLLSIFNSGPGAARNSGLKIAQGEYILFVDADDYVIERTIDDLVRLAKEGNLDILMGDFFNEKISANPVENPHFRLNTQEIMSGKEFLKNNGVSWTVWVYLFKKDFLIKYNLIFREKSIGTDTDFSLKSIFYASRIRYVRSFFYSWVYRKSSVSHSNWTKQKIADAASGLEAIREFAMLVKYQDEAIYQRFRGHMTAKSMGYIKRSASLGFTETRLACESIKHEYINHQILIKLDLKSRLIQFLIRVSPSLAAASICSFKFIYRAVK